MTIVTDNFFTSIKLGLLLYNQKIYFFRIIRQNIYSILKDFTKESLELCI